MNYLLGKDKNMKKINLTESQLRDFIKESAARVIKEMNETDEISSDMLTRARDKFSEKYRHYPNFEKDEYGNPLHPKDKRLMADHYRDFDRAISNAKYDEEMQDPMVQKACELYQYADFTDEEQFDNYEHGYGEFGDYAEVEDENGGIWKFYRTFNGHYEGDSVEMDELEGVEFETPDGKSGSFHPNYKVNENRVIKIDEKTIKKIIAEGVKKVLKEMEGNK